MNLKVSILGIGSMGKNHLRVLSMLKDVPVVKIFDFNELDIIFLDDIIKNIIQNYTAKEEGVRNLKRCIETIVSKINIFMLTFNPENPDSTKNLSFQIKDFQLPITITTEHISTLLKISDSDNPPEHMYM